MTEDRALNDVFARLARSDFRRRFRLRETERAYLAVKGQAVVLDHARDFIAKRLGPAHPPNDGKQTPMRGHPVFVAQHATATCCRGCLEKWHAIAQGRELSDAERSYVLSVIAHWLSREMASPAPPPRATKKSAGDLI